MRAGFGLRRLALIGLAAVGPVLGGSVFADDAVATAGGAEASAPTKVADLDLWGSVAPSGTKVAFVDWSTGNLALHDLVAERSFRLTDKGSWTESGEFGMYPIFSPDERWIAYAWFNAAGYWDLRLQSLSDPEPRVLLGDPESPYVQPHAFSPDGESVLATVEDEPMTSRLVRIDVGEGDVETLASLDWRVPSTACFAGGGEVIFDRLPADSTRRQLYRLRTGRSAEGHSPTPLTDGSADHLLLACSPDGQYAFFASDREGQWDLWRLEVGSGEAVNGGGVGRPERVVTDVGPLVRGLGVTRDGSLYYGLQQGRADLYMTSLGGRQEAGMEEHGKEEVGVAPLERLAGPILFNSVATWSRDGERLAYVAPRGTARSGLLYSLDFVMRTVADGSERRRPLAMTTFGGHTFDLDWAGDDEFVLAQGRDRSGREGYYRIDPASGAVDVAVQSERCPPACLEWPTLAGDGTLYFTRWTESGQGIVARDLASGAQQRLMPVKAPTAVGPLSVSPDGEWLAGLWKEMTSRRLTLKAMAPKRRSGRDLAVVEPPSWVVAFDWMPDSQHLLYVTTDAEGQSELWRVGMDFRPPEKLGVLAEDLGIYGLRVHPDGRRLAVTAGTPRRSEVWVATTATPAPGSDDD